MLVALGRFCVLNDGTVRVALGLSEVEDEKFNVRAQAHVLHGQRCYDWLRLLLVGKCL